MITLQYQHYFQAVAVHLLACHLISFTARVQLQQPHTRRPLRSDTPLHQSTHPYIPTTDAASAYRAAGGKTPRGPSGSRRPHLRRIAAPYPVCGSFAIAILSAKRYQHRFFCTRTTRDGKPLRRARRTREAVAASL